MNKAEITKKAKELETLLKKAIKLSQELQESDGVSVSWIYEGYKNGEGEYEYTVNVTFQPPTPPRKVLVDYYS